MGQTDDRDWVGMDDRVPYRHVAGKRVDHNDHWTLIVNEEPVRFALDRVPGHPIRPFDGFDHIQPCGWLWKWGHQMNQLAPAKGVDKGKLTIAQGGASFGGQFKEGSALVPIICRQLVIISIFGRIGW